MASQLRSMTPVAPDRIQAVQGSTTLFNLTISEADIAPQRAADPAAAAAEWDGLSSAMTLPATSTTT